MKRVLLLIIVVILLISGYFLFVRNNKKNSLSIDSNLLQNSIEFKKEVKLKDIIEIKNGTLENGDLLLDTSIIGKQNLKISILDNSGRKIQKDISFEVKDTLPPEVSGVVDLVVNEGTKVDFYKNIKVSDNSDGNISKKIEGIYDLKKPGKYNLKYVFSDESGNETVKEFILQVKAVSRGSSSLSSVQSMSTYYVKVNKTKNVVMVYAKDNNGEYTKLVKTFVASAGKGTPLGVFYASDHYEKLSLVGGVWGHYTVRISGPYWFHSVPYYSKPGSDGNWDDLEYEEYNKLGTLASKGCIRLAVSDAKWIYDNIAKGTTIEIYASDTLPDGVTKPIPIHIDVNDIEKRGWDPTDSDPDSPYNS